VASKYSPRYLRDSECERIAEAKRNWSKNFTVKETKNAYVIAVAIALIVAAVLLVTIYFLVPVPNQKYTTIYLLDANKKATDLPESLVANANSTFSVYVEVENHMGQSINETVLVKVTGNLNPTFPVNSNPILTFNGTLKNGETSENIATISLNQPGDYFVIFELWIQNPKTGTIEYTSNFNALNIQVTPEQNMTMPTPTTNQN
jgi:uncharacterized membrane protein